MIYEGQRSSLSNRPATPTHSLCSAMVVFHEETKFVGEGVLLGFLCDIN